MCLVIRCKSVCGVFGGGLQIFKLYVIITYSKLIFLIKKSFIITLLDNFKTFDIIKNSNYPNITTTVLPSSTFSPYLGN